ncbi:lytic transglycosylase domain-containing protein [Lentisphaera profundi]|uniref:Lytic transglycosylase domain-containing protein n=1 Tax=Lentisphaera profundi TaxID=1658616 RepID=A0ABY7W4R9_9BACT|nr:lytic transglycosylase domain-containing protein [Lentisphaera profundi]WDE99238.1 lytic transglycosylase domain-containing protein [Lentisphaera profundi]
MRKAIFICLLISLGVISYLNRSKQSDLYDSVIHKAAQRHQVPFSLIKAVIRKESSFIAKQKGAAGEYGLMQIMPIAADEWARLNNRKKLSYYASLYDPEINIDIGTYLLSVNLKRWQRYDDRLVLALAEYNAGLGNLRKEKWNPKKYNEKVLERITFPTTKKYVSDILLYRTEYLEYDK